MQLESTVALVKGTDKYDVLSKDFRQALEATNELIRMSRGGCCMTIRLEEWEGHPARDVRIRLCFKLGILITFI